MSKENQNKTLEYINAVIEGIMMRPSMFTGSRHLQHAEVLLSHMVGIKALLLTGEDILTPRQWVIEGHSSERVPKPLGASFSMASLCSDQDDWHDLAKEYIWWADDQIKERSDG